MEQVARSIKDACNGHIHLAIVTHEHWDHVSGFSEHQARAVFDEIQIDQVWYAWTEDPSPRNKLGNKLRHEREAKVRTLRQAAIALNGMASPLAVDRAQRINTLLSFFGFDSSEDIAKDLSANAEESIGKTRSAFDYLSKRSGVSVRYCRPTDDPVMLAGGNVRAYVLGPPEDEDLIKRSAPSKAGREVYEVSSELFMDQQLETAFERLSGTVANDRENCPFETAFQIDIASSTLMSPELLALKTATWDQEPWRQIDSDWTAIAESLALNLDQHTNNTCLVIAFELVATGQVLLFAADAQVGNWLSWQDVKWTLKSDPTMREQEISGPDLLARTVFYKVGHHGSHNATLRAAGLEQMTSKDLIAFVPVDKSQAEKNRWHEMPFEPLMNRLREKTAGRVVRSDATVEPDLANDLSDTEKRKFLERLYRSQVENAPYWEIQIP
ncbi:hypothetical protein [Azonexus sp. IMCC34839]|uniref:hypothetical protein n=1 Tax=Azonexus sp. IMCC34839 TaxID=3133695 RepID=UPI003999DD70